MSRHCKITGNEVDRIEGRLPEGPMVGARFEMARFVDESKRLDFVVFIRRGENGELISRRAHQYGGKNRPLAAQQLAEMREALKTSEPMIDDLDEQLRKALISEGFTPADAAAWIAAARDPDCDPPPLIHLRGTKTTKSVSSKTFDLALLFRARATAIPPKASS